MRIERKIIAGLLAITMMTASIYVTMSETKAADTANVAVEVKTAIEYIDMSDNYEDVFGKQDKVPSREGYIFGGWFTDNSGSTAIKTLEEAENSSEVWAKFVPAHALSVKAQIYSDTKKSDNDSAKTSVRLVTSLDCRKYQNAGFDIIDMSGETDRIIASDPMDTAYSALRVKTIDESGRAITKDYTAEDIFGILNEGKQRLVVLTLNNIPETKWGSDIYVRPYWTTLDGVKVYGLAKYIYVNDDLDGWISVPVNLHTEAEVAAGMLSVDFPSGLEYKECRAGVVFEEMDAVAIGNTVKCVGNIDEISNVKSNDMYITLRFKVTDESYEVGNGTFLDFAVKDMAFCNIDEEMVPMKILNVRY